jgi:signal transduction histidine kinase
VIRPAARWSRRRGGPAAPPPVATQGGAPAAGEEGGAPAAAGEGAASTRTVGESGARAAGGAARLPGRRPGSLSRLGHATVPVLAVLGTLLLGASAAIELSNTNARLELWSSMAAGATFLIAMALSRGSDAQVLALRARLLVGAGLAALLAVAALWQATERTAPRVLLLLIPVCLLFTTAALALREAAHQRRQARLRELRSRQAGEETERRRWVRELHDDTLQELAAVHVLLAAATAGSRAEAQTTAIASARDIVGRQIHALRRLISQMRPLALDTLGLAAALEDLARQGDTSGIDIQVRVGHLPRLPPETETSVYRIVQEALTNAVRHSGARHIGVQADRHGEWLEITIRDDGRGHPAGRFVAGHGLLGMQDRAETLGALLRIAATGGGTRVHLRVPCAGADQG